MFLKRIDILGFKSFANKTTVEFAPGITAVVGPNGSGKSNIADAIRWVLGEQSARSLRGTKMEDVIFAGSESRKSINFCEVSLTLDNSDHHLPVVFDEVTVTRRVYRSGESEYLINKQTCRLKDVHELFMDSGLGRESYSIVGQGKIEEMLSTRPEDRRGPFEDAAGIVKFKFRRKEAERRLEETAANIVRVDDILAELERQAGPLEKEAERAAQYKALADQLQGLDISLILSDVDRLRTRFTEAGQDVNSWTTRRAEALQLLEQREANLAQARVDLEQKTAAVEAVQRRLIASVETRQRRDGDVALLRERLANAQKDLDDRTSQRAQLAEELRELAERKEDLAERLQLLQAQLEAKTAELEAAAHEVDPAARAALEADVERLNADIIELHHQAATFRNERKSAQESLHADGRRKERLAEERDKWQSEVDALQAEQAANQAAQAESRAQAAALERSLTEVGEQIRDLGQREAACARDLHQLESAGASLRSRLELLKDLEQGYDGYALGVKTVLQAADKGRLTGIYGALAGLMVVERRYETAIETALGAAQQNIVVSTEAAARAAIDMLKKRQAGRATFMPLDVIRSRRLPDAERQVAARTNGFIGIASELVTCAPEIRVAVEHLLGNVVIAETLVAANELARKLQYRTRVVTLDGDVVSPGGVMSGGSHTRRGPGLLGRSREQQDVQKQLADVEEKRSTLQTQQAALRKETETLQAKSQSVARALNEAKVTLQQLEAAARELQAKHQNAADRLQSVVWEQEQLEAGRAAWQERAETAERQLADTEASLAELEAQVRAKRAELELWDKSVQQAQESMTALKVEVATLSQERAGLLERKAELEARMVRLTERDGQLAVEQEQVRTLLAATEAAIESGVAEAASLAEEVVNLEAELTEWKQARTAVEQDVAAAERLLREQQAAAAAAEEQLHRAQVALERTDMELNHVLERLGEQYHMTVEWARSHYEPAVDVEQTKRQAEGVRRQMQALGDVQLSAIEEWSRLSERMGFLTRERDDLEQARVKLADVIQEIDTEMSKRFEETFEQIRTEFQVMFRLLFNGGRADLELNDPADLLHTGIEVIAQPPGKRLQNLNLMSGGERALTAMALLFAILRVRPVPFCVLDEVEAALDEANVSRFAQQLRKFSDDTQFIVITHRRGTMEEADVLYGVTMQESGISSLVSVRLTDDSDIETAG
ncbi:chromosome segregation protein SMC [Alicyclobacillus cycloheptanicus]|uniref:Chromosome partition protein Smc n=1 Tax=Alicyclobacillus cycloheptanicus TaxID=1457 RepID=A0ABT9XMI2_9BACL|nr:chromosome segregation protein SMC [Alicyclobacillus cycloheptanicus]MDQ0191529.1 chromosome segregation protein [Alicyclobacillus cycloheptanicus]WDM01436.1 chromosome segregation protein SMC [Alicyclobacillus cycloheptanicus]